MTRPADRGSSGLALAEQLLTVLADGAFTATYKYAVLLALVDLCVEQSTRTGGAPTLSPPDSSPRRSSNSIGLRPGSLYFVRTLGSRRGS